MKAYRGKGVRIVFDVVRERGDAPPYRRVSSGIDVARYVRDLQTLGMVPSEREAFMVLALDARHGVIGFQVVSVGSLGSTTVHPREVFRFPVIAGAAAILVAHNHPSGDPHPSIEDRRVTDRLQESGKLIGIELLDHVVVGETEFYSFADERTHRIGGGQ
jgi:DNA repair protein RadC